MSLFTFIFYLIAFLMLAATAMAVTRRHMVHAVLYLVLSFFGTAMLFYLLGAPFLAAMEVIIYAGAIMILFLFILMMIKIEPSDVPVFTRGQWIPAAVIAAGFMLAAAVLVIGDAGSHQWLALATASPREFGRYLFQHHWLAIEIASLLLLIALIGALYLGRLRNQEKS